MRRGIAWQLPRSVLLAAEALKRASTREAERILRLDLALLGTRVASMTHDDRVQGLAFSRTASMLPPPSFDGTARVWMPTLGVKSSVCATRDPWRRSPTVRMGNSSPPPAAIAWPVFGAVPAARNLCASTCPHAGYAVTFSADGRMLAAASYDGSASVWDVASGARLARVAHDASSPRLPTAQMESIAPKRQVPRSHSVRMVSIWRPGGAWTTRRASGRPTPAVR